MIDRRGFIRLGAAAAFAGTPALLRAQPAGRDVEILAEAFRTMHPGLYRYASPRTVEARFAALGEAFAAAPTLAGKYLALSRMLGSVRCGHTYANFYNQDDAVSAALFAGRNRLPFRFRWLGTRMIVTADTEAIGLRPGTEIVAIDGRPAGTVLAALLPLARADGGNDAKRRSLLGVEGVDRLESFDIYYPLLFPMIAADYRLTVRPLGGAARTLRAAPIDLARRRASMPPVAARNADPGWTLDHSGAVTIITMNDWALYDSTWDWRGWIGAAFDELMRRGSRVLIVDLRANEGGLDCGDEILARLTDRPLALPAFERRTRFRTASAALRPYLDTWDRSFDRIGAEAVDIGDGFFRLPGEEAEVIPPQGPFFPGRLIVLTGPRNSSATFRFAQTVQLHRLGLLVGAATGGNRRGINGGAFYFLRLPESGLEADLPLIGYFPRAPQPDAGLEPDVAVEADARDLAAGRDPVLARALALAAG